MNLMNEADRLREEAFEKMAHSYYPGTSYGGLRATIAERVCRIYEHYAREIEALKESSVVEPVDSIGE